MRTFGALVAPGWLATLQKHFLLFFSDSRSVPNARDSLASLFRRHCGGLCFFSNESIDPSSTTLAEIVEFPVEEFILCHPHQTDINYIHPGQVIRKYIRIYTFTTAFGKCYPYIY